MSDSRVAVRQPSTDRVLESVADSTRRDALAVLREASEPVSVRELASAVAALQSGRPPAEVTHADRKPVAVALVHVHLPKLASTALLEWAPGEDVVATLDDPALDDRLVRDVLSVDAGDWDAVLRALADRRRRLALSVLEGAGGSLDRAALARRVAARERGVSPAAVPDEERRETEVDLRHRHLPTLCEAGLVAEDGDAVEYVDHPDLPPAWLSAEPAVRGGRDAGAAGVEGGSVDVGQPQADQRRRSVDGVDD